MIWTSLIAQSQRQLWMSLLVATLVAVVYFHFARFYQGGAWSWLFTVGWVPVLLNVLRAGVVLYHRLDRQPFHVLDLGLENDQVAPGKPFEVEIRAQARRPTELRRLAVELRCTRQKSTERGRQRSVLDSIEKTLEANAALKVGETKTYHASLPVPADAPFSFRSMEGKITWAVHVELEVEGWGELTDELEVTVAPG